MNPIVEIENLKKKFQQQEDQLKYLSKIVGEIFCPTLPQYSEQEEDQFWGDL